MLFWDTCPKTILILYDKYSIQDCVVGFQYFNVNVLTPYLWQSEINVSWRQFVHMKPGCGKKDAYNNFFLVKSACKYFSCIGLRRAVKQTALQRARYQKHKLSLTRCPQAIRTLWDPHLQKQITNMGSVDYIQRFYETLPSREHLRPTFILVFSHVDCVARADH